MRVKHFNFIEKIFGISAILVLTPNAHAIEGGLSSPIGGVDSRTAMLPPPGVYSLNTLTYSAADRFNDNSGNPSPALSKFKIKYQVLSLGLLKVWDSPVAGGTLGSAIIAPLHIASTVEFSSGPFSASGKRSRLGQVMIEPIAWSKPFPINPESVFFLALGTSIHLPTNNFDANATVNTGPAAGTFQPYIAGTLRYGQGWDFSSKFSYHTTLGKNKNYTNPTTGKITDYKDGNVVTFEYGLSKQFGLWSAGLNGYSNRQISADKVGGVSVANNNYRADALGPFVGYDIFQDGKPWGNVVFKIHREYSTANNPQIETKLGVKFGFAY
jgi:hypothetical protein